METGDWRCCNRDTIRAFGDVSLLYDAANGLHLAFTTVGYFCRWLDAVGPLVFETQAQIWHWTEERGFELVAGSWILDSLAVRPARDLPEGASMVGRPCLTVDEQLGTVYCAYTQYDTAHYSSGGELNADVFISRREPTPDSTFGWSVGTNITNTPPTAPSPAPAGHNRGEKDVSSGLLTRDDTLVVACLVDYTANAEPVEPPVAANSVFCQRLAVSEIADFPRMPWRRFSAELVECGLSYRERRTEPAPVAVRLFEPYPNPFNTSTELKFRLPQDSRVSLHVYDVLGKLAAVLIDGELRASGNHAVNRRPVGFASGVYFASLRTDYGRFTEKLLYLR